MNVNPKTNPKKRAVFFDRDNTLIKDIPYNGDADLVELLPHTQNACHMLKQHGFLLFVITNQSGVGRGFITADQVNAVNQRMLDLIGENIFTDVYCCYDSPHDQKEFCRKPSPAMLLNAQKDYELDLSICFMVGDKLSDIQSGHQAGCKTVFLESLSDPHERQAAREVADFSTTDLLSAAQWICEN